MCVCEREIRIKGLSVCVCVCVCVCVYEAYLAGLGAMGWSGGVDDGCLVGVDVGHYLGHFMGNIGLQKRCRSGGPGGRGDASLEHVAPVASGVVFASSSSVVMMMMM